MGESYFINAEIHFQVFENEQNIHYAKSLHQFNDLVLYDIIHPR